MFLQIYISLSSIVITYLNVTSVIIVLTFLIALYALVNVILVFHAIKRIYDVDTKRLFILFNTGLTFVLVIIVIYNLIYVKYMLLALGTP